MSDRIERARDAWALYRREMRSALRERSIVINGIFIPIILYPALLWVVFSALLFIEGLAEGFTSRVAIPQVPAVAQPLVDSLLKVEGVARVPVASEDEARARLSAGSLDAVLLFETPSGAGARLADNPATRVLYDRAEERSRRALQRIGDAFAGARIERLEREASAAGIGPAALRAFSVDREDVSTDRDSGRALLAVMVPLFLTVMVALGCFIPAVDTTAGERERSTWETLWTTGASRGSVVMAKYLYVATLGVVAGVLNVLAVTASLGGVLAPLLGERARDLQFALPWSAVPVMLVGAVVMALFFAAAMMILAAFARSFKDGQAMVTPVYWLALLPLVLGSSPDRAFTPTLAVIPVANIAMAVRDAILGQVDVVLTSLALVVNLILVAVCLHVARSLLQREEVVTGSFEGSFWRWIRRRRRGTV